MKTLYHTAPKTNRMWQPYNFIFNINRFWEFFFQSWNNFINHGHPKVMIGVVRARGDGSYEFDLYRFFSYRTYWNVWIISKRVHNFHLKPTKIHIMKVLCTFYLELQLLLINTFWYPLELSFCSVIVCVLFDLLLTCGN